MAVAESTRSPVPSEQREMGMEWDAPGDRLGRVIVFATAEPSAPMSTQGRPVSRSEAARMRDASPPAEGLQRAREAGEPRPGEPGVRAEELELSYQGREALHFALHQTLVAMQRARIALLEGAADKFQEAYVC